MANLTNLAWLMQSRRSRNGWEIQGTAPTTTDGNDPWAFACWVWAIGNHVPRGNVGYMDEFYDGCGVLAFDPQKFDEMNKQTPRSPKANTAINLIKNNYDKANRNEGSARLDCRKALFGLALIRAGLEPFDPDASQNYQIVARYDDAKDAWYARPQHFALALIFPNFSNPFCYVQKVPTTGIRYACSTVWDEGYAEMRLGIADLTQEHVKILQRASAADHFCA